MDEASDNSSSHVTPEPDPLTNCHCHVGEIDCHYSNATAGHTPDPAKATTSIQRQKETMEAAAGMKPDSDTNTDVLGTINSLLKQKRHAEALTECNKALESAPRNDKLLEKKVKVLCQLGGFRQAFTLVSQWLQHSPEHPVANKELKRLQTVIAILEDQDSDDEDVTGATSASQKATDSRSRPRGGAENERSSPAPKNTVRVLPPQPPHKEIKKKNDEGQKYLCLFCDIRFERQEELDTHCHSDLHKKRLASDESHNWHFRPPPRGQSSEEYLLCQRFYETDRCPFGDKCTQAHSEAELEEWRERFAFRKQQLQEARDHHLHGNTFTEQLLERLTNPDGPKASLVQNLDFVKIHVNSDLKVSMTTKKCTNAWTFTITSKICLHCVALLDDANRSYFHISSISVGPKKTQKYQNLETHCQEWINQDTANKGQGEFVYRVKIVFKTDIYGTFRQSVVLDFGLEAVVAREVQVESTPATDPDKLSKDLILTAASRWTHETVTVVPFTPKSIVKTEKEEQLVAKYVLPRPERLSLSETLMQSLSKENYRLWMHEMLYLEEMAELGCVQRFNVTASLQLVNRFLLMPGSLSSAKYTREGELFARLKLEDVLSEDSMAGRLILQNAQAAWIAPASHGNADSSQKPRQKVYEAAIEDKGKNFVFFRLSSTCVAELKLTCDEDFSAQIQFQLNRLPKCEMHAAVDALSTLSIVFPDLKNIPKLPPPDTKVLAGLEGMLMNDHQREAILSITAPLCKSQPPLLIIGPFGTGKTYTLAQAAKLVLEQEGTRILICTHSNSAADLYIRDFLHPYVEDGHQEARPLRVYYRLRWMQTVSDVILPYSLLVREGEAAGTFAIPTLEDINKHRVVITTLSTARYIEDLGLPAGFFSHIFIDEAAQALECETLIPLSMAGENTRIVLAGDHMQISPEVYSAYTRQQGFHLSFLERLYDLYPPCCSCKVMLCENYRSHGAIVDFTSDLFYDHRLIASGKQVPHPNLHPLSFFAAMGEEVQHENSTGFFNLSELYEIVDRVDELRKKWPEEWGDIDNNGISVVAPYMDQVIRIRGELRKRKIYNVSVERVLNVQGKQYRVIIISAVRTRRSCRSDSSAEEEFLDYGFLSNVKLLNTAITRAQSLVLVVGDPVSLCLVGKCRKVWEYFLEICHQNGSLFGTTWTQLRSQLDRAEVAKNYVLNPLAPEFVPNRLFHITRQAAEAAAAAAAAAGAAGGPYIQQGLAWNYIGGPHQQHPLMHANPYHQMYAHQMMPYYPMHYLPPYMSPVVMRGPGGASIVRGHPKGFPRPAFHQAAAAQRSEGIRMMDVSHSLRPTLRQHRSARMAMYMPRMSVPYPMHPLHPMYSHHYPAHHPGSYFMLPDDPRLLGLQHQHPYPHPHPLQHHLRPPVTGPHTHLHGTLYHQGMPLHAHPANLHPAAIPGRGSPSEQGDHRDESPDTRTSPEAKTKTGFVTVSGSAPGFQVLPNVVHVPAHLRPGHAPSSQNSSCSSTPISQLAGPVAPTPPAPPPPNPVPPHLHEGRGTPVSERPYSPANYAIRSSPLDDIHRDRSGSREREVDTVSTGVAASQLTSNTRMSDEENGDKKEEASTQQGPCTTLNNQKTQRKQLRLKTGFSRQFSDDLPTPTAITDIVRMIEENIEEGSENSDGSSPSTVEPPRAQLLSRLNGRNAALSSLQLDLAAAQRRQHEDQQQASSASSRSTPSSSSPATLNGERPTYAGILRKSPVSMGLVPDIGLMEPQTPRTPSGFITPGVDVDMDPFGILKSLNIEATIADPARLRDASTLH